MIAKREVTHHRDNQTRLTTRSEREAGNQILVATVNESRLSLSVPKTSSTGHTCQAFPSTQDVHRQRPRGAGSFFRYCMWTAEQDVEISGNCSRYEKNNTDKCPRGEGNIFACEERSGRTCHENQVITLLCRKWKKVPDFLLWNLTLLFVLMFFECQGQESPLCPSPRSRLNRCSAGQGCLRAEQILKHGPREHLW